MQFVCQPDGTAIERRQGVSRHVQCRFSRGIEERFPDRPLRRPFGALFGAVAVDNGLSVTEATIMSGTVYAGASQLVGIELFGQKVAPG